MGEFVMHEYRSGRTATRRWWWSMVALAAALVVAVPAVASSATLYTETDKLVASDGDDYDAFGHSVAFDGNTIVVGAPGANDHHGAVYVYTPYGEGGSTQTKLVAPDGPGDDWGFRFGQSVAVDGDTIVVGADGADRSKGAAYVFTRGGDGVYTQRAKLTADNVTSAFFGISVAVDGDIIVVGAPTDYNDGGVATGAAYVFTGDEGVYTETAKLVASDGALHDYFGFSVAVDGDTIVVGAESHNDYAGAAYVFTGEDGVYTETAKLVASDGNDFSGYGEFGFSVAVDGDTIVVSAPGADTADVIEAGAAYVFTGDEGVYTETAKLVASDRATWDWFGGSVAVDGDTIVIGAPGAATDVGDGAAYVFTRDGGAYTETAKLLDSDGATWNWFGESVAVDGDTIVIGVPGADTATGAAYVFTATSDSDDDTDGDGVADADDECPNTILPDEATRQLKPNRYETVDVDGSWAFVNPAGNVAYTLADTRGCSLSQIVERAGLGQAHQWFGITRSALNAWVNG